MGRKHSAAHLGGAPLKGICALLLLAACSSHQITQSRSGWQACHAADPNLIECGGKVMAQVECFQPGDETCGALAVHYTDGERVFLYRPAGFDPGKEATLNPAGVLRPELASNGRTVWFKPAGSGSEYWTVFDVATGVERQVSARGIFEIREKDPHSMPLWVVTSK